MAPMTRGRAGDGRVPTALNAKYYGQRSGAGLIIAEAAQVSEQGIGYIGAPGIHTEAQAEGWRHITDAPILSTAAALFATPTLILTTLSGLNQRRS